MNFGDTLSAFQSAAGLSAGKISVLVRTVLLALTFVWAAWCVYGTIHHLHHGELDAEKLMTSILRILFVITLMMGLVFI